MTISVIANFKAKSDQKERLEALLQSVIEPTLQEEGCLKYELYISENDSSRYFFLEEWRSREDLDIHMWVHRQIVSSLSIFYSYLLKILNVV